MRSLLVVLGFALFSSFGYSQTGTMSGRAVYKESGEPAMRAQVRIVNTALGTITDLDGKYTIKNIPAGNYQVTFIAISYKKDTQSATIIAGQNTELSSTLVSNAIRSREVQITKKRKTESLSALSVIQKNSIQVADGISSDMIKRTPDRNTGDVVKRVSGASIQEGKFAVVRGLADRYNNAMLNSTLMSSTEADRKSFAFDLIPAAAIDNLMIYKTASPDLSGDFAGGIIQIMTKEIPEEKSTSISVGVNVNELSTFLPFIAQQGSNTDMLGLTNGRRTILPNFPEGNRYNNLSDEAKLSWSKRFANTFETVNIGSALPGGSIQFANNWNMKKEKFELGSIFSLNYSNNFRAIDTVARSSFNAQVEQEYTSTEQQYRRNLNLGGVWNIGMKLGTNHKFSLLNLFNNNSESLIISRNANDLTQSILVNQTIQQYIKNTLLSHQFTGESSLDSNRLRLKYQIGTSYLNKSTPDLRRTYYYRDATNPSDTIPTAYVATGVDIRSGGRFFSDLEERAYNAGADAAYQFKLLGQKHTFKLGGYTQIKSRTFNANVLGYAQENGSSFDYNLPKLNEAKIYDTANMNSNGFVLRELYSPEDRYKANSNLVSGFAMFDNKIGDKFRIAWGVRIENFYQELLTPNGKLDTAITGIDTSYRSQFSLNTKQTYLDILPSFNFIYSLSERSNLRLSASKTLSRPEFRELSRFSFYDYTSNATTGGNPDLQRTNIYNFDLRYEIFEKFGQMFTVSGFYKYFDKPIETTVAFTGPETRVKSFVNASSAVNYGAEMEFKLRLSTLVRKPESKVLSSFYFSFNGALIYSKVKFSDSLNITKPRALQGQSPYVINTSILYTHPEGSWTASVFYNVVGDRIFEVGSDGDQKPNVIEKHRHVVDLQFSKRLSKRADIKITLNDLLAQKLTYYVEYPVQGARRDFIVQNNGRTWNLSFNYRF